MELAAITLYNFRCFGPEPQYLAKEYIDEAGRTLPGGRGIPFHEVFLKVPLCYNLTGSSQFQAFFRSNCVDFMRTFLGALGQRSAMVA